MCVLAAPGTPSNDSSCKSASSMVVHLGNVVVHDIVQVLFIAPYAELCPHPVMLPCALDNLNWRQLHAAETLTHACYLRSKLLIIAVSSRSCEREAHLRSRRRHAKVSLAALLQP